MTDRPLRVYVNSRGVDVEPGASALDAVRAHDRALAERVEAGTLRITDSRGLDLPCETSAHGGAIYRVVRSRTGAGEQAGADAFGMD